MVLLESAGDMNSSAVWCIKEDLQQPKPGTTARQPNWLASNWDWGRDAPGSGLEHKSRLYILNCLEELICLLAVLPA